MAVSQRLRARRNVRRKLDAGTAPMDTGAGALPVRPKPVASPAPIAVIYRWGTWLLALGLIVTGASGTFGPDWSHQPEVYLLLGLTFAVNLLLTVALRPYIRLMRRYPPVMLLDILFCLAIYAQRNIWTSPFQFYSYSALMLPVVIFFYAGALAGSVVFLALNVALLYAVGDTLAWARTNGAADTYLMQLAIVPLLAFVFAYPNRIYAQLRRAQQRLAVVEREQILLSERTRIAGSLHDSVAQILFGIGMLVESAQARMGASQPEAGGTATDADTENAVADTLHQVHDLATRGNREMRRAIYSLREPGPGGDGLPAALSTLLNELAARTGIETHLSINGSEHETVETDEHDEHDAATGVVVSEPVALALYNVAREAIANVEKHAGAINVWVALTMEHAGTRGGGRVSLAIRDDGHGFRRPLLADPGESDEDELGMPHFGLGNMRATVEAVGGRFELATAAGRGTTVTASVPPGVLGS